MPTILLLATLAMLNPSAGASTEAPVVSPELKVSPTAQFRAAVRERFEELKPFKQKLQSGALCPGQDFQCLVKELRAFGVKSSSEFAFGVNLLAQSYQYQVKERGACSQVCRVNLNAQFIDALIGYQEDLRPRELIVHAQLKGTDTETQLLQALEELNLYTQLETVQDRLRVMLVEADPEKAFRKEHAALISRLRSEGLRLRALDELRSTTPLAKLPAQDPLLAQLRKIVERDAKKGKQKLQALERLRRPAPEPPKL
jgi:hypothetical protein